ncbi:MAG: holo-[acyl-carrier-protein] synthase [Candidatus Hepatoplasma scabrum]|nr:MAG: holo-[acyl-carrier-protein] synthase [Candidatus Hepatoplasma sp.]
MKTIGIGTDIVENKRLDNLELIKKFLSKEEFEYFIKIKNRIEALSFAAGRFAAKEAIIKAYDKKISLSNIKIVNNNNGKPIVFLDNKKINNLLLSISHEKNYTIAFVILLEN